MKTKLIKMFVMAALAVICAASCQKDNSGEKLTLSSKTLTLSATDGSENVAVITGASWKATADVDWITLTPSADNKLLLIAASDNIAAAGKAAEAREATVTVSTSFKSIKIAVTQSAEDVVFKVEGDIEPEQLPADGGNIVLKVSANIGYTTQTPDWIEKVGTKAAKTDNVTFSVMANTGKKTRKGDIVITPSTGEAVTITVMQSAIGAKVLAATFSTKLPVSFKAGDKVKLTDGVEVEEYELLATDITETGAKISTYLTGEFSAIYPASAYKGYEGGKITFDVPTTQDGSVSSAVFTAKASGSSLAFADATAAVRFEARSLTVNQIVCGSTKANVAAASGPYFIVFMPTTLAAGTIFEYKTAAGSLVNSTTLSDARTLAAGDVVSLGSAVISDAVTGAFSISATKKVALAKGNLRYKASDNTWSFAKHQYDAILNFSGNTTATLDERMTQSNEIDLFGWGATGFNEYGAKPYDINNTNSNYKTIDVPVATETLTIANKSDWGYCMGGSSSPWFTMTRAEMCFILQERKASTVEGVADARFAPARIDTYNGLLIFPDVFTSPAGISFTASSINNEAIERDAETSKIFVANRFTLDEWALLEAAGCAFLPTTCNRSISSSTVKVANECYGFYWNSDAISDSKALSVAWDCKAITGGTGRNRSQGCAVRLVTEVK